MMNVSYVCDDSRWNLHIHARYVGEVKRRSWQVERALVMYGEGEIPLSLHSFSVTRPRV